MGMDASPLRRSVSWLAPVALTFGLVLVTTSAAVGLSTPQSPLKASAGLATCPKRGGVTLQRFAFTPSTVPENGTATLNMTVANCTWKPFIGSVQTSGMDVCIVVDPIQQQVRIPRRRFTTLVMTYAVPQCAGTGTINGQLISRSGQQIESDSASFTSVVPPPSPTIVASPDSVMVNTAISLFSGSRRSRGR